MARKVLIIDDEPVALETMSELCRSMGLEVTGVAAPKEALAQIAEVRPDLIVLDLLLPGIDGFKLGAAIRKAPGGEAPILAVSGAFKQPSIARELWQALQAEYLPKPFDAAAFKTAVGRRLGLGEAPEGQTRTLTRRGATQQNLPAFTTNLRAEPAYRLFARLFEGRASGHLELTSGNLRRRLTFHLGQLRYASSNAKQETVGGMQVARGELDEATFRRALEAAKARRLPLSEALTAVGAFDRARLDTALKEQVREIAVASIGLSDAEARFTPDAQGAEALPDHRIHPLAAIVEGVRRFWPTESLQSFVAARQAAYLHPTPLLGRESFTLRATTPGERLTVLIDGQRTLGELQAQIREADLPLLFALVATGLARMERAPQGAAASPVAPTAAPTAPQEAPAPRQPATGPRPSAPAITAPILSQVNQGAQQRVEAEYARLSEASHYDVLGVSQGADPDAIQKAYVALARIWHSDRFSGVALGESTRTLEAIFARIAEAKTVLLSPEKRQEYDIYLDRKAKGLPTDVAAILRAEELFQDGELMIKAGRTAEALERFEQAIALNHAEGEFYAWRGYARFLVEGEPGLPAARADLARALESNKEMAAAHYLLGMIALRLGDTGEAEQRLGRALAASPEHKEAAAQLRHLRQRGSKEKGGLLRRLMKK